MKIRVKINEVMELSIKARHRFGIFAIFLTHGGHDYFG
jgi:hypothetical protein